MHRDHHRSIRVALERTAPELSTDISDRGLVLTSGGFHSSVGSMPSCWAFPSAKQIRVQDPHTAGGARQSPYRVRSKLHHMIVAPVYIPIPTTDVNRGLIAKGASCVRLCLWVHTRSRANAALESIALRLPEPRPSVRKPHNGRYPIAPGFYSCGVPAAFLD